MPWSRTAATSRSASTSRSRVRRPTKSRPTSRNGATTAEHSQDNEVLKNPDTAAIGTGMTVSSETPAPVAAPQQSLLRRAWEGWKKFAHVIGVFNTRVIMSVLYFIIVLPFGLVFRQFSDPLQLQEPPDSNWVPLPP